MTSLIERVEEIVPKWQRGQMSKHHRVLPVLYNMAGKNTKVGTPTLPEAMKTAVAKMAPDRHVANRVIILVSAMYRSADIQAVKEIVQEEGIGLISVGLDGSVGAMKPLKGYDVTQIRELNGIREQVEQLLQGRGRLIRRQVDFSMNRGTLRRSSSTELENIADLTHLQEVTTEAEE
ncbi:Oidioi.mRNA.OKI2018_I69.chr2.g6841.t1.cds [Oikopleura dioica]|uniref:Oidioi.mRNA.OKI2018_I69.chr2.g6841.t1.cds n=1 Tax=Oikopleura dioica TaxID=34765 RepID=A0ABN7T7U0_OIKDI|nr:Oidioi.mRNA.OKI2018_I69.chr2.g6841.t1.cds [Oikopleura dioica]